MFRSIVITETTTSIKITFIGTFFNYFSISYLKRFKIYRYKASKSYLTDKVDEILNIVIPWLFLLSRQLPALQEKFVITLI